MLHSLIVGRMDTLKKQFRDQLGSICNNQKINLKTSACMLVCCVNFVAPWGVLFRGKHRFTANTNTIYETTPLHSEGSQNGPGHLPSGCICRICAHEHQQSRSLYCKLERNSSDISRPNASPSLLRRIYLSTPKGSLVPGNLNSESHQSDSCLPTHGSEK